MLFLLVQSLYQHTYTMNKLLLILAFLLQFSVSFSQSLQFTFNDSTFLPLKPAGQFHGISGIDYDPIKKQWHLASDRGAYFVVDSIETIRDFAKREKKTFGKGTTIWFESVRIDPSSGRFIYSVENDFKQTWENQDTTTAVAFYDSYPPKSRNPQFIIPPIPLPADNKGIEGIAVTQNGNVWVAPEAGWFGETEVGQDTIHFKKFIKTEGGYTPGGEYSYVIDRSGCPYSKTEKRGGISEIISVEEDQLLVLERCFDNGVGGTDLVKAKLWQVSVQGTHLKKEKEPAFDFNKGLPFLPDNLEGMAWWPSPDSKRMLLLIVDDNPGLKNKQRTQLILLKEK